MTLLTRAGHDRLLRAGRVAEQLVQLRHFLLLDEGGSPALFDSDPRGIQVIEIAPDAPPERGALEGIRHCTLLGFKVGIASAVGLPDPFGSAIDADFADGLGVGVGIAALPVLGAAHIVQPPHDSAGVPTSPLPT
jgi:hypothetical protein